ncbi:MAG: helix-turn-helix transcriptional regulator [Caldilineaceae bacterium]
MNRFGEKLLFLRKRKGLTQKQLADLLGVTRVYIVQMEQGKKIPNAIMILKIADIFAVDIDQLMRDELEVD